MSAENINYEAVLADLESKKADLENTISGIRRILGQGATISPHAQITPSAIPSDAFFQMSILDAAEKYLGIMKKPQSVKAITDALLAGGMKSVSKDFGNNVRAILRRDEISDGNFIRINSDWALAEWYPARRKAKQNQEKEVDAEKDGEKKKAEETSKI